MTNNLSVMDVQIGANGDDLFVLNISISIEACHNLFELVPQQSAEVNNDAHSNTPPSSATQYWLSYRCFGKVIQSDLFCIPNGPSATASANDSPFVPTTQTFRMKREELTSYFNDKKNATLRIHLCTEGNVIATASVDFGPLITFQKEEVTVVNEYNFKPRMKDLEQTSSCARVAVTLSLDKSSDVSFDTTNQQQKQQHLLPSKSTMVQATSVPKEPSPKQSKEEEETVNVEKEAVNEPAKEETESKRCSNVDNDDAHRRRETQLLEKEAQLQIREDQLSKKEQQLYESLAKLEKRRLEWEQSKHQEELTWQEKLRNKEAEMMGILEERITQNERERLSSIDKTRSEYEQLEKRLTKAIVEVEAKDRAQKELQEGHQHEYSRKLAELELREKLIKKEMKHTVEIEQAKAAAALEQAVLAKKEAAAAAKKVKQVEAEMDELREKHRKTPEAALLQQLAEIKGQLADSERRIEAVKAEKNQVLQDKEKFRINVKKLAKALRQERDKAVKRKEESHQNVRLSYDDSSGQFVLGGEESEVHRILQDLSKLTQKHDTLESNRGSPVPLPLPSRPLGMDEVLDNISLSFLNEAKHCSK